MLHSQIWQYVTILIQKHDISWHSVGCKLFQLWNSQEQTNTYFLEYYKILILPDTIRMKDKQSPNILENTNFDVKEKSNLTRRLKKKSWDKIHSCLNDLRA